VEDLMKNRYLLPAVLLLASLAISCNQPATSPTKDPTSEADPPASTTRMFRIDFKDSSDVLVGYQLLFYDAVGNLTGTENYDAADVKTNTCNYTCVDGKVSSYADSSRKTDFFYDASGKIDKAETRNVADNSLVKTSYYTYDALGKIATIIDYKSDGSKDTTYEYTYDNGFRNGLTVRNSSGAVYASAVYYPDSSNRLVRSEITYNDALYRKNYYSWEDKPTTVDIGIYIIG